MNTGSRQSTIVVAGDSWASGVWQKNNLEPVYQSSIPFHLHQFGFDVINLGAMGLSNLHSVQRLHHFLLCNPARADQTKFILFWMTEFYREIWFYNHGDELRSPDYDSELAQGYKTFKDFWIYRPYHRLSEISQRWNIPIYILGGCSDAISYDDFSKDFPGLHILCQSITNLLINNDALIAEPVFSAWTFGNRADLMNRLKRTCNSKDLQALTYDIDLGNQRRKIWIDNPGFWPDQYHPGSQAHTKIFEFLLDRLVDLKTDICYNK